MTEHREHTAHPAPRKRRRIFRWVFLAVQLIFLAWIIGGSISASRDNSACKGLTGHSLQLCHDAGNAGTAIGVGLIIFLWLAVDAILAVTYLIFRKR
jgi:hypothetical protein